MPRPPATSADILLRSHGRCLRQQTNPGRIDGGENIFNSVLPKLSYFIVHIAAEKTIMN